MIHSHRAFSHLVRATGEDNFGDDQLRHAAWVARCVGRLRTCPLRVEDYDELADRFEPKPLVAGSSLFVAGAAPEGVWFVRQGLVELSVGSAQEQTVIDVLRPGDLDGDLALLLETPPPYTARARTDSHCLFLPAAAFDALLADHPDISRRWLTSVAKRLAAGQGRLINMLGRPLPTQLAQLLLDEAVDNTVDLPHRTLAAMLGTSVPTLNKALKEFDRDDLITLHDPTITLTSLDRLHHLESSH
ncbi:Crp/Fnr family transcriptional regulator [Nocardia rosealba]|uniref:Crp/Fnr family transcriptional regulator n=1 Tax=Nocardia rosealba TaxID=2878563 RepID=UPI001CDA187E|nr:Crp/Fnr family transcriptional regulator [Nocardia rosealba]MCA2208666.1 Crp/Fnr family transcriptional regulator [Nocardia rosealba]